MDIDEHLHLPPDPGSARAARRFVATVLVDVETDVGLVALLVSELVSNVVLHAHTPLEVSLRTRGNCVRVTVTDQSPIIPAMKRYAPDSVTGRGLTMVDVAADRWGIEEQADGKAVWFEVSLQEAMKP
jgi:anti-sigma regulatory factor (Ser/Thr protein kinase)